MQIQRDEKGGQAAAAITCHVLFTTPSPYGQAHTLSGLRPQPNNVHTQFSCGSPRASCSISKHRAQAADGRGVLPILRVGGSASSK